MLIDHTVGEVTFKLRQHHDFSWLEQLGHVYTVFDQQDSGNLAFGVLINGKRAFIKYAGAATECYDGNIEEAIDRLRKASVVYHQLKHPALITFIQELELHSGYALLFDWFDGECMHAHWLYAGERKYKHPDSPFYKYRQLSVEKRLASFQRLLEFQAHAEAEGYIAVDLYDGSVLYNFTTDETKLCDIDFYQKAPVINNVGEQFWGTTRFKSPEEYELGAVIDERTNVFTLGAMALYFLGGGLNGSFEQWEASEQLYQVAKKATDRDRSQRHYSVSELKREWERARQLN